MEDLINGIIAAIVLLALFAACIFYMIYIIKTTTDQNEKQLNWLKEQTEETKAKIAEYKHIKGKWKHKQ